MVPAAELRGQHNEAFVGSLGVRDVPSRDAHSSRRRIRAGIERRRAHKFLRRHGVPCLLVVKVGSPGDMGEVATCQDGREWALFWLEDEIAFVHPQTREPYRWDRELYWSHPEIYAGPTPGSEHRILASDGR